MCEINELSINDKLRLTNDNVYAILGISKTISEVYHE